MLATPSGKEPEMTRRPDGAGAAAEHVWNGQTVSRWIIPSGDTAWNSTKRNTQKLTLAGLSMPCGGGGILPAADAMPDEGICRVVGITSTLGGEGKNTNSMNLANILVEAGK